MKCKERFESFHQPGCNEDSAVTQESQSQILVCEAWRMWLKMKSLEETGDDVTQTKFVKVIIIIFVYYFKTSNIKERKNYNSKLLLKC